MTYACGRIIYNGLSGIPLTPVVIDWEAGETGLIINNDTRVALIKLIGSMSRVDMMARAIAAKEHDLLLQLYQMVQT